MNAMFNRWSCWIFVWLWGLTAVACQPTIEPALTPDGSTPTPLTNQELITPISSLPTKVLTPTIPLSPTLSISPTASLPPTETSTFTPIPTPIPSATPILLTDPGRILYMEAPESDNYGYSTNEKGYVYAISLNENGEPLGEPSLLSSELPTMWGDLIASPDKSRVLIVHYVEAGSLLITLYPDTGKTFSVIAPVHFFGWHPNSRQVLLWGYTLGPDSGLWLQNVDVSEDYVALLDSDLLDDEGLGAVDSGAVSPDGQTIIYSQSRSMDSSSIWMINSDGSNRRLLWESPIIAYGFQWSPDGKSIAFLGGITKQPEDSGVIVMDADGSNLRVVSHNYSVGHAFPLSWSPDSQMLAFNGECSSNPAINASSQPIHFHNNIHLVNVTTGKDWPLLQDGCGSTDPAWSPDSHYVTFASVRSGHPEIWVAATDGTNLHQLTYYDGALVRSPVWLPTNTVQSPQ